MLSTLPEFFRDYGLAADVRTLLLLRKAMDRGLVQTLGDMYGVLKGILVKDPTDLGPFTKAYYMYFLQIGIENGESLDDAILRSETFRQWLDDQEIDMEGRTPAELEELVSRFLDQVHLTHYDIKEVISGRELFDKDNPDTEDKDGIEGTGDAERRNLETMADYSDLSLEEILERLEQIRKQQRGNHGGGSHWVGTGGISPYGHGGAAKNGVRVGGTGGGKMARKVLSDRNYFPVDMDALINDNNVDAALASLKGAVEESSHEELDIPLTIKIGLQRGGLFIPELVNQTNNKLQLLVFIDNGGYSMMGHMRTVRDLFKKMKTRFAHDLQVFYFHNTIYSSVFTDAQRRQPIDMEKILSFDGNYRVFIIGDASMAPYELSSESVFYIRELAHRFKKTVWLNPEPERYWWDTYTIHSIMQMVDMFPLTPRGIEKAVRHMNRKTKY
ncbi:MAG: hypothetical protein O3B83_01260 [Bacteroidetes bacterium]|nr:hypothetical protein [Bacteroidota bacterium]